MSKTTVVNYKKSAERTGMSMRDLYALDDAHLHKLLQPHSPVPQPDLLRKKELDAEINDYILELAKPYMTVQLVWETYHDKHPDGYKYTQFKKYINDYKKSHAYSYHNVYVPGHEMQIDFAGDHLYIFPDGTTPVATDILCCILPYSNMAFAMALRDSTNDNLFYGLNKALYYFGGVPEVAKSDNMSQWVTHTPRYYDLSFTDATTKWALHYGLNPELARVRKPRDKGPVEGLVNKLYQFIYARIRDNKYRSIDELNNAIFILIDEFNDRKMQRKDRSRREIFEEEEKIFLNALPETPFTYMHQKDFKVGPTYHVFVGREQHAYSIPYQYVSKPARVCWDMENVYIYVNNERVAVHKRSFKAHGYTTVAEHMPPNHRAWQKGRDFNAESILYRASLIGPKTKESLDIILHSTIFPQQSYRNCMTIINLAGKIGPQRMESVCDHVLRTTHTASVSLIRRTIENNADKRPDSGGIIVSTIPLHDNIRGAAAYDNL